MALNPRLPNAQAPFVDSQTGIVTKAWLNYLASLNVSNAYPVGSIYTTSTAVDPSIELGFGTWTLYAAGPPAQWERLT